MNLFFDAMNKLVDESEKRMDDAGITKPVVPPVVVITCPLCKGDGWRETSMDDTGIGRGHPCSYCAGKGRIATEGGEA